jgi:hypothetical protein
MRTAAALLVLALPAAALDADEYFEKGVGYLRKGFFGAARRAFAESLARAPGQPVPLAFLGLASAAEGRPASEAALALRDAYALLPEGKTLSLDLAELLPSRRALRLLEEECARRLARARAERERRDVLSVAAFLEVHGGGGEAPSLDRLLAEFPGDAYASRLRAGARPSSAPTTPPTASAPSSAAPSSTWDRSRTRPPRP